MLRELITVNPRKVRRTKKAKPRRRASTGKRRAVWRRNPRMPAAIGGLVNQLVPAAIGGGGALAIDIAIGNIPHIPEGWKVGWQRTALRVALAVGMGYALRYVPTIKKQTADQMTAGALTVIAYDAIKGMVQQQFPALTLGAYRYEGDLSAYQPVGYSALPTMPRIEAAGAIAANGAAEGNGNGMGAYITRGAPSMIPAVQ